MKKTKKVIALALAATMMFGGTLTAFAADGDTTGSATQTGEGTSEGTVDTQHINVVLPVVPDGSTPFKFTVDPERLVTATNGEKYSQSFTDDAKTNGVYFLTADGYDSTSETLQVVNKSSEAVMLSVKVKATAANANPIALGATSSTAVADTASLYLALKVGDTEQAVTTEDRTVTKKLAGVADNYEITYDAEEDGYAYTVKSTADTWKAMNISMTGAVTQSSAKDANPPSISVTWSFALPSTEEEKSAEPDDDAVEYTSTPADPYANATDMSLTQGSTAIYAAFADLGFESSDITATVVKVDDGDYQTIQRIESDTALKFNIDSEWADATSVKIYVNTSDGAYVYQYK